MKIRPILFPPIMVRALLAGRKTMTRRVLKPQPEKIVREFRHVAVAVKSGKGVWEAHDHRGAVYAFPDGKGCVTCHVETVEPGDLLWVREAHAHPNDQVTIYRANWREDALARGLDNVPATDADIRWRPSIHMCRDDSRLTLEVTGVEVERLQEITHDDCIREGIEVTLLAPHLQQQFRDIWNSLNGPSAWDANPWVAAISFEVHRGNVKDVAPQGKD